jgi:hypothetical protein
LPVVTLQVTSDGNFLTKVQDPNFWRLYKAYVLQELTEGALETIRRFASRLWKNPSGGGLDQSWFSTYGIDRGTASIYNSKPYAYWLNNGIRPHRMSYLLGARTAWYLPNGTKAALIPISTGPGKGDRVFRVITAKHLDLPDGVGPWWHKGRAGSQFLALGMEEYRNTKLRTDFDGLTVRLLGT